MAVLWEMNYMGEIIKLLTILRKMLTSYLSEKAVSRGKTRMKLVVLDWN